ncbi:hypothetical protein AAE478_007997 [Parahypoxylon ruwenzoriense]
MNSPVLSGLPTEVLNLIFRNHCLHCRAKNELYAPDPYFRGTRQRPKERSWLSFTISSHLADSWRSTLYTWDGRCTSFLRTVARRRDLAAQVKRVCIHPYLLEQIGEGSEARAALSQAAQGLGIQLSEFLASFPEVDTSIPARRPWQILASQLMCMLVAALPNLEHLSLQTNHHSVGVPASALKAAGVSGLRLRTLDISSRSVRNVQSRNMFSLNEAGGILEMAPNLSTLNLHMCGCVWYASLQLPGLETLRITHSILSRKDIECILLSCIGLRSFVYKAAIPLTPIGDYYQFGEIYPMDGKDHFHPSDAMRYLRYHGETLKLLHIDLFGCGIPGFRAGPSAQFIPNLEKFIAVESLVLSVTMLYDEQVAEQFTREESLADYQVLSRLLPPTVVSLRLSGLLGPALSRLMRGLCGLVIAVSHGEFPKLKWVGYDDAKRADEKYGIGEIFANVGVEWVSYQYKMSEAILLESDILRPVSPCGWQPLPDSDDDL